MPNGDKLTPTEFAQKIKAKYPAYQSMDDNDLVQKIIQKYPEYKDNINFDSKEVQQQNQQPTYTYHPELGHPIQTNDFANPQKPTGTVSNQQVLQAQQHVNNIPQQSLEQKQAANYGETFVHAQQDAKIKNAAINTVKKQNIKNPVDADKKVQDLLKASDNGDVAVTQDASGNDVLKPTGNFIQNFNAAYKNAFQQRGQDAYLSSLSKDKAIEYLNQKEAHPELFNQESDIAPSGISKVLGEQADMLIKGAIGGVGGTALAPETGGGSMGTFLAMTKDLASGGYSQALQKNYYRLKELHPEMSDNDIYDKAHQAALTGEAVSLGTGALLSAELPKPTVSVNGVLKSLEHTVKSSPKVVGSAALGSVINDTQTNAITGGQGVTGNQMFENAKEQSEPMAAMHFGLGALSAIANGSKSVVPSYVRPQIENIVASADRNKVTQIYQDAENKGIIPQGTTQKVLQKLNEFDEQKKVVENLPIPEENKAAIAGKLIQKQDLLNQKAALKPNENALPKAISQIDNQISGIDGEINKLYDAKDVFQKETDTNTGEKNYQPKTFEELKPQEQSGIVVPKDYGDTDVQQKGEGENKTFTPKAFYVEKQGSLEIKKNIPVEGNFTDKSDAQEAADKALKQHYYENGLHDNAKPDKKINDEYDKNISGSEPTADTRNPNQLQKSEEVQNQKIAIAENNESGNTGNGRQPSNEGGKTKESVGEVIQPQQKEITPEQENFVRNFITGEDGQHITNTLDRINNAEYINEKDLDKAADGLYSLHDKVDNKSLQNLIEPLISKIENYDFRTKTESSTVTEKVPVEVANESRKPTIANKSLSQWEGNRATVADQNGKAVEGQIKSDNGKYGLFDNDGNKISDLGEKALTDRDITLPSKEDVPQPIGFDKDGNVKSITLQINKLDKENGGTIPDKQITIQFKDPEKALDYAIQLRAEQVGEIPQPEFGLQYQEIQKEIQKEVPVKDLSTKNKSNEIKQVVPEKIVVKQPEKTSNAETSSSSAPSEATTTENKPVNTPENTPPEPPKEQPPLSEDDGENKVGVSHASLTDLANRLGLKQPERGQRLTPEQFAERGRKMLASEPDLYKQVETDFKNGKQPTADDISVARAHLEDLSKIADAMGRKWGVDSEQYGNAIKDVDKWANEVVKPIGTAASEPFTALQGERDLDTDSFTTVKRTFEDTIGKKPSKEQEQKIKELTDTNQKLKDEAQQAEAKLIEETDKAFKAGVEEGKKKSNSEKAKSVANRLRESAKLHKPDSFSAATPASLAWDAAIEVVAKGIEAGGKLADVIEDGLNHIRNTDWYKSLADDKKNKAEQDFKQWNNDTVNSNNLKDLQAIFLNKKGNKFTTSEAKSIWDYAKENYLDKGTSYRDAISQVSNDLGLSWRQISDAITTPKNKRISDEMWNKQANYRRNQNATKTWIEQQDKSGAVKLLNKVSNAFRGVAVFGHGGIFVGTHAGATLFQPSTWSKTIPAFFRGWKFAYGNTAKYERAIEELKHRDNYVIAQRAGLKNNPERINAEEYQKSQKFLGKLGDAGERGFNAIKVLRQDLFDYHYNKLSSAEKQDPESAKSIARLINNATGATNLDIPKWVNDVTFAGGMEAARWGKLTRNPIEATSIAIRALRNPEKASTADKVFAKVWASRVGQQLATYATLLAANAAIQKVANPKNPTNLTDPSKYDWLRFKFGDNTLDPTSGMVSVINFIGSLIGDSIKSKKERHGDTVAQADYKNVGGYLRGKLSPAFGTLIDLKTGTDYSGNTLPYNSDKPQTGRDQISWLQYASEKLPLPVAEAFSVMFKSAQDNGMPKPNIENVINGIAAGVISGTTGFRVGETKEKQEPFNEQDKKDPTFKYFLDKGLQLPNTSLSSEKVPHTGNHISDYPKDIQDKYEKAHKDALKAELQDMKDNDVYVTKIKNLKGEVIVSVSKDEPSEGDYKQVPVNKLTKEELTQVLSIAQKQATANTKKEIFGNDN